MEVGWKKKEKKTEQYLFEEKSYRKIDIHMYSSHIDEITGIDIGYLVENHAPF